MTANPVATREGKISDLEREVHAIDKLNLSYWMQGAAADAVGRAEYNRRIERLEDIRRELDQLRLVE